MGHGAIEMRMFIKACQMDPLNKISCSETQNLGGRGMHVPEKWVRPSLGPCQLRLWPHGQLSQADTHKEDQTSLCVPMRPTQELLSGTKPFLATRL